MTTLDTGLPINRSIDSKITPALRLSVQKASSAFQKDFCYDFLQALVDEPEIADPIGIRLFLNFCLKKPETLVESWSDAIDQTIDLTNLNQSAESILYELDNFLEFIHGLVELIELGEVFKLAYHEIDAWKLTHKLLEPIQRRIYELALQDRDQFLKATNSKPSPITQTESSLDHLNHLNPSNHSTHQNQSASDHPSVESTPELIIASDSINSGFYQAFVSLDKFLKHAFESRVLLEPAKLVDDLTELNKRRTELQSFRSNFPSIQTSNLITKKFGRFGREESAIDNFLESEKFKELTKLKNTMSGGRLL